MLLRNPVRGPIPRAPADTRATPVDKTETMNIFIPMLFFVIIPAAGAIAILIADHYRND